MSQVVHAVRSTLGPGISPRTMSARDPRARFFGIAALLFAACTAATIVWCDRMSAGGGMPMPGGWTMSMAWVRMPGETWAGAEASFLGMWVAMMAAMMLPSVTPALWRFHQAVGAAGPVSPAVPTALVGAGYLAVWTALGAAVFPAGVALAAVEMRVPPLARAVPIAAGVVVLVAGLLQFTAWKTHHLACCGETPARAHAERADADSAWRHGLRLGLHCICACAGPMAILLAAGLMDLRAMAVVTAAITAERLAPGGARVARALGAAAVGAGLLLLARAVGLA